MCDRKTLRPAGLMTVASALALVLIAMPVAPSFDDLPLGGVAAFAKGGNGGGNGGGHGGGGKGGHDGGHGDHGGIASAEDGPGHGNGHGKASGHGPGASASAPGHSGGSLEDTEGVAPNAHGVTASMLGRLNSWMHASETARMHANHDSTVGLAAEYEAAILAGDVAAAVDSLVAAANKDVADEIEARQVVRAVNSALDITVESEPETTETAEATGTTEATETTETTGTTEVTETTETTGTTEARTISREVEDAVVAGFAAGAYAEPGATEEADVAGGEETAAEGEATGIAGDGEAILDGTGG
ncbi:MAG: hypothetical protein ACE5KF_11020 [Kiloniellaceae bacterium]